MLTQEQLNQFIMNIQGHINQQASSSREIIVKAAITIERQWVENEERLNEFFTKRTNFLAQKLIERVREALGSTHFSYGPLRVTTQIREGHQHYTDALYIFIQMPVWRVEGETNTPCSH